MGRLLLVDVNGVLHRARHAYHKQNLPNGGLRGVALAVMGLTKHLAPTHIAMCQDNPGGRDKLWRAAVVPSYKQGRPPTDEDIKKQLQLTPELSAALGAHHVTAPLGFEADDVMATLADTGVRAGLKVSVLAFDKDLLQLVSDKDGVEIVRTGKGTVAHFHDDDVVDNLSVPPALVPDLFALMGDSSDGFIGVPGVGPKKALALINMYGGAMAIHKAAQSKDARLEKIKKGLTDSVIEASIPTMLKVALTARDVPGMPPIEDLAYRGPPCKEELIQMYLRLSMPALAHRVHSWDPTPTHSSAEMKETKKRSKKVSAASA